MSEDLVPAHEGDLLPLQQACRFLDQARHLEDVVELRDRAQAALDYFKKRRDYGSQAMLDAAEIKIRAERRIGELIPILFPHGGDRRSESSSHYENLKSAGIDHNASSRCRKMTVIPREDFERHIAEVRAEDKELTTAGVLRLAAAPRQPKPFDYLKQANEIRAWLSHRRDSWPEDRRPEFINFVRQMLTVMESDDRVERRLGTDSAEAG